jgi:hypothetical protein
MGVKVGGQMGVKVGGQMGVKVGGQVGVKVGGQMGRLRMAPGSGILSLVDPEVCDASDLGEDLRW